MIFLALLGVPAHVGGQAITEAAFSIMGRWQLPGLRFANCRFVSLRRDRTIRFEAYRRTMLQLVRLVVVCNERTPTWAYLRSDCTLLVTYQEVSVYTLTIIPSSGRELDLRVGGRLCRYHSIRDRWPNTSARRSAIAPVWLEAGSAVTIWGD
jgi:hypothetical protein